MTQPEKETSSETGLFEKFKAMAETVQAVVTSAVDLDEIFTYVADLTVKQGGKTLAAVGFSEDRFESLGKICEARSLELLSPPFRERPEGIHTGLTYADWAIAETGTLVIDSASEDTRIASMLCETHVAVIDKSGIRPDAMDLEKVLDDRMKSPPGYTAFITGASRTADIERVLTIGVHGPQELHILITEEHPS